MVRFSPPWSFASKMTEDEPRILPFHDYVRFGVSKPREGCIRRILSGGIATFLSLPGQRNSSCSALTPETLKQRFIFLQRREIGDYIPGTAYSRRYSNRYFQVRLRRRNFSSTTLPYLVPGKGLSRVKYTKYKCRLTRTGIASNQVE